MIFGRRTVTVHGKLLEGGLGRKRTWRVSGSLVFGFVERFGGSISLGLRCGGCREKNQRRRRGGESRR